MLKLRVALSGSALAALIVLSSLPLAACDNKGPGEKTGEKLDKAGQKIGDALHPPGPMEKAGRTVDNAVNSATTSD